MISLNGLLEIILRPGESYNSSCGSWRLKHIWRRMEWGTFSREKGNMKVDEARVLGKEGGRFGRSMGHDGECSLSSWKCERLLGLGILIFFRLQRLGGDVQDGTCRCALHVLAVVLAVGRLAVG